MAESSKDVISSKENRNPNSDILFDLDTEGEVDLGQEATSRKLFAAEEEDGDDDAPAPRRLDGPVGEDLWELGEAESEEEEEEEEEETEDEEEVEEEEEASAKENEEEVPKEGKELEEEEEAPKEEVKRKKPVVLFVDGKKQSLPPDTIIQVKEDGKLKKVSLSELTESYSSSEANLKNYRQLKTEREEFEETKARGDYELKAAQTIVKNQIQEFTDYIKKLHESASTNPLPVLCELFERVGQDALPAIRSIRNALLVSAAEWASLSEEQRRYLEAVEENDYLKSKNQRIRQLEEERAKKKQEDEKISKILANYSIPDRQTYDKLVSSLSERKQKGEITAEITPDYIGDYWQTYQSGAFVLGVVKEVAPELINDRQTMFRLIQNVRVNSPNRETLVEVIKQLSSKSDNGSKEGEKKKLVVSHRKASKPDGTNKKHSRYPEDLFI